MNTNNEYLIDLIRALCAQHENILNLQEKVVDGFRKNNVINFALSCHEQYDGYYLIKGIIKRNGCNVFVAERLYSSKLVEDEIRGRVLIDLINMIFSYGIESANRQLEEIKATQNIKNIKPI